MTRPYWPMLAVIVVMAGIVTAVLTLAPHPATRTVTRTPTACTRAALQAEANQLAWQRILQAHVDVENEALDGIAYRTYRRDLAAVPAPPTSVGLAVCR